MGSKFTDRVALVTGASSGVGEAIALMFAREGARVTLCGRDEEKLRSVMNKCIEVSTSQGQGEVQGNNNGESERSSQFLAVSGDLREQAIREETIKRTIEKFGRLDILVPNAGVVHFPSDLASATLEVYDSIMDTNLKSTFFLIQAAAVELEKTRGNIVSISSALSTVPSKSSPIYAMTKAGVDHMTRCLALDLAPRGIRVNAVNPAYFASNLRRTKPESLEQALLENEAQKQPLHKRLVTVEELAEIVGFLASETAGFVTGECLMTDGGRHFLGAD